MHLPKHSHSFSKGISIHASDGGPSASIASNIGGGNAVITLKLKATGEVTSDGVSVSISHLPVVNIKTETVSGSSKSITSADVYYDKDNPSAHRVCQLVTPVTISTPDYTKYAGYSISTSGTVSGTANFATASQLGSYYCAQLNGTNSGASGNIQGKASKSSISVAGTVTTNNNLKVTMSGTSGTAGSN